MQKLFLSFCIVALFYSAIVQSTSYVIVADFVEERYDLPNATLEGKLYYLYDDTKYTNSRLRFDYTLPGDIFVSNLYHYANDAKHSMFQSECTSFLLTEVADPWFFDEQYYNITNDAAEPGFTWYKRSQHMPPNVDGRHGSQVDRILLGSKDKPTSKISIIEFSDGRTIRFYNVSANPEGYGPGHPKFDINPSVTCPTAAASVYADVIFVLDNSESINTTVWKQQNQFVIEMMNAFPFGSSGLEAAIVQFNAPKEFEDDAHTAICPNRLIDGCFQCIGDWNFTDANVPGRGTAEVIAGEKNEIGTMVTVSASRRVLDYAMNSFRPEKIGNTCQGYGLELALSALNKSARNAYRTVPNRVVIVLTDGLDMCPNKTADTSKILQDQFGALVIEIGLNIPPACEDYHKKYLERISTDIRGTPSYFALNDFDSIHDITDKVFKLIFDHFKSECDPLCKSFCGAGHCFCPKCKASDSTCYDIKCAIGRDGKSSHGCEVKDIPCEGDGEVDGICKMYKCLGNETGEKRCAIVENECLELKEKYNGTCHKVKCHYTVEGGCYVELDHAFCQHTYGDGKCVLFECTPPNETVPEKYRDTGCRPKANYTDECLKKYEGQEACYSSHCDLLTGECVTEDKCKMEHADDKCYSYECTNESGKYECKKTEKNRPTKSMCTDYQCSPDDGWVPWQYRSHETCRDDVWDEHYKDPDVADYVFCKAFACDEQKGCLVTANFSQCNNCSSDKISKCLEEGRKQSTVEECVLFGCHDTGAEEECYEIESKNCLREMAVVVTELNQNGDGLLCYTPACGSGGNCSYVGQVIPKNMPITRCMRPKCTPQSDGSWIWVYEETEEKRSCDSNACFDRQCDDDLGCVNVFDKCANMSNKCYNYTCDDSDGEMKCVNISLLSNSTCIIEGCYTENVSAELGIMYFKSVTVKNLSLVCVEKQDDHCKEPRCRYDPYSGNSWCYYVNVKDPKPCIEDKCLTCDCNPETGDFDIHEKCVSGDNCTMDECDLDGVCSFTKIECDNYLNMTGYDCFSAECKPAADEPAGFKCYRKLFQNAYIDVCGTCIKPWETESSSEEDTVSATTKCTGAPARPLLKEGLAAASVALIIISAVVVGLAVAGSSVYGTKVLIDRAKQAETHNVVSNPMFQEKEEVCYNTTFEDADN